MNRSNYFLTSNARGFMIWLYTVLSCGLTYSNISLYAKCRRMTITMIIWKNGCVCNNQVPLDYQISWVFLLPITNLYSHRLPESRFAKLFRVFKLLFLSPAVDTMYIVIVITYPFSSLNHLLVVFSITFQAFQKVTAATATVTLCHCFYCT